MKFENKIVVIIGGNSGIGFVIVKFFYKEGVKVIIIGRWKEVVESVVVEIGENVIGIIFDILNLVDIN